MDHAPTRPDSRPGIVLLLAAGVTPFLLNGWYNPRLASRRGAWWAVEVLTWVVLPVGVYDIGSRAKLFAAADLGLTAEVRGRRTPPLLIVVVIAATGVLYELDRWAVRDAPGVLGPNRG